MRNPGSWKMALFPSQIRLVVFSAIFAVCAGLIPVVTVYAHSPLFPEGNHSIQTAYQIDNPAKSWATYTALDHAGTGDYYKFKISSGQRIVVSLLAPQSPSKSGFLPSFALLVPGSTARASVPTYVETPPGYGTIVVNGTDPRQATYEAFAPGWYYELANLDMNAPTDGVYYLVVFDPEQKTGEYGLPVGYLEEFTAKEIVGVQYEVNRVYLWEGQKQFVILLPVVLTLVAGGLVFWRRNIKGMAPQGTSKWLAGFAGLAFVGSAASRLCQMILGLGVTGPTKEAGFTLIFVAISLVLAVLILRYAVREKSILTTRRRIALIVIGVVALFSWSGLYFGSALVIAAALVPYDATLNPYRPAQGQI